MKYNPASYSRRTFLKKSGKSVLMISLVDLVATPVRSRAEDIDCTTYQGGDSTCSSTSADEGCKKGGSGGQEHDEDQSCGHMNSTDEGCSSGDQDNACGPNKNDHDEACGGSDQDNNCGNNEQDEACKGVDDVDENCNTTTNDQDQGCGNEKDGQIDGDQACSPFSQNNDQDASCGMVAGDLDEHCEPTHGDPDNTLPPEEPS